LFRRIDTVVLSRAQRPISKLSALVLVVLSSVAAGFGQTTPPGIQIGSTNEFGIDLASGNIHIEIPIRSKAVGPNPLAVSLVANYGVQNVVNYGHEVHWWVPPQAFAAQASGLLGATIGATRNQSTCGAGGSTVTYYDVSGVTDASGTFHYLTGYVNGVLVTHGFTIGPPNSVTGGTCSFSQTGVGTTIDGSGYTISGSESGIPEEYSYVVYDSGGNTATTGTTGGGSPSSASTADGVAVSTNRASWTDALTSTPMLSYSPSAGLYSPGTATYSFTDINGTQQKYSVAQTTLFTVQTNFMCGTDLTPTAMYLPTAVTLPGNYNSYKIAYEATPGYPGSVTGRIAKLTYPSGGSFSYAYSGGSNNSGYQCTSGVVPTLAVTVNDNNGNVGTWTYVNTNTHAPATLAGNNPNNTFTVTKTGPPTALSPNGDQTVFTFNNEFLVQSKSYQGLASGTPLSTIVKCYNGNLSNCASPTAAINLPLTEIDTYTTPNGYSASSRTQVKYDPVWGNLLYSAAYDFGASTPTSQKTFYYGQSWQGTYCSVYAPGTWINNTPCYVVNKDGSGTIVAQSKVTYSNTGHPLSSSTWVSGTAWLTTTKTFTSEGVLASVKEPNSALSTFSNFACNSLLPQTITAPISAVGSSTVGWDCNGGVITAATDYNGQPYTYEYIDPLYRMTKIGNPDGGQRDIYYNGGNSLPWSTTVSLATNSGGAGALTVTTVDGLGRAIATKTSDPNASGAYRYTNISYNNLGQLYSVTNPFFTTADSTYGVAYFSYDALGRRTQVKNQDGTIRSYTYSKRAAETVDEAGITSILEFNGLGQLVSNCLITNATQANGAAPTTCGLDLTGTGFLASAIYDALGRKTSVTASGQTRSYVYDGLSRITQQTTPEAGIVSYTYDASGMEGDLSTRIAPLANQTGSATTTTTYSHDQMHRLTQKTYSDGVTPMVKFGYDETTPWGKASVYPKGQLTSAQADAPSTGTLIAGEGFITRDVMGRISSSLQNNNTVSDRSKPSGRNESK
jgi:YD repeat-containing protein